MVFRSVSLRGALMQVLAPRELKDGARRAENQAVMSAAQTLLELPSDRVA